MTQATKLTGQLERLDKVIKHKLVPKHGEPVVVLEQHHLWRRGRVRTPLSLRIYAPTGTSVSVHVFLALA